MTTFPREPMLSPTLTTLTELRRSHVSVASRSELERGLNRLNVRLTVEQTRRRVAVRWSIGAVATTLAILAIVHATSLTRHQPTPVLPLLAYQIEGGQILDNGYLKETEHLGMALRFNEGSAIELTPGARGRLRSVAREGARFAIDSGTVSFRITPNPARSWWVESGPFVVAVKGTVFEISWEPSLERFELKLREGRVTVDGPVSGGTLALHQGQRLLVNLAKSETVITEGQLERNVGDQADLLDAGSSYLAPVSADSTLQGRTSVVPPQDALSSSPSTVPATRSWAQALAQGRWDDILAEVNRVGAEVALNRVSSEDLYALADAARYRRRVDLAKQALLAQRRRFPNSSRATDALYLLGRVEESRGGATARALVWYDEYLKRAPSGAFAAEALGRKMIIANDGNSTDARRLLAESYLRQFPKGSYAGTARAILRER